ncbi:unnamed protein product, partial [Sphagnum troendelagicum]
LLRCSSNLRSLSGSGACLLQRSKLRSFSASKRERCFGACCVAASKLRRLLLQRNKLRSRTSSGTGQAPEPDKLRSLLRCSSKLS